MSGAAASSCLSSSGPASKRQKTAVGGSDVMTHEIDFEEDDIEALLILLKIAHLQFTGVPATLSYERLLNVAILCDKYDCIKLVKPWVLRWCESLELKILYTPQGKENYIFVAWVFGRQERFNMLAKYLITKLTTNAKSECLTPSGETLSHLMPEGLIDNILKIRAKTISKLLKFYLELGIKHADTLCKRNQPECSSSLYGSVMRPLAKLGVWPKSGGAPRYFGSIDAFSSPMNNIQIHGHNECKKFGVEIQQEVTAIVDSVPSPVLLCHNKHFTKELLDLSA